MSFHIENSAKIHSDSSVEEINEQKSKEIQKPNKTQKIAQATTLSPKAERTKLHVAFKRQSKPPTMPKKPQALRQDEVDTVKKLLIKTIRDSKAHKIDIREQVSKIRHVLNDAQARAIDPEQSLLAQEIDCGYQLWHYRAYLCQMRSKLAANAIDTEAAKLKVKVHGNPLLQASIDLSVNDLKTRFPHPFCCEHQDICLERYLAILHEGALRKNAMELFLKRLQNSNGRCRDWV